MGNSKGYKSSDKSDYCIWSDNNEVYYSSDKKLMIRKYKTS